MCDPAFENCETSAFEMEEHSQDEWMYSPDAWNIIWGTALAYNTMLGYQEWLYKDKLHVRLNL